VSGPGASHMSGGLGSTAVAVLAARALREQGRSCLAYSYQEARPSVVPVLDERPYVDEASRGEENIIVKPIPSPGSLLLQAQGIDPDIMWPLSSEAPERVVLRDAASNGASIILSGWGGDQIVTSSARSVEFELFRTGHWLRLLSALKHRSRSSGRPIWREFATRVGKGLLPSDLNAWIQQQREVTKPQESPADAFIASSKRNQIYARTPAQFFDDYLRRQATLEDGWISHGAERLAQLGSQYGVAYAFPMLDLDLIQYAARLPSTLFRREGIPRRLIRDALAGVVPESVRWRVEKLAAHPLEPLRISESKHWIASDLRDLSKNELVREYLDVDRIAQHLESFEPADVLACITRDGQQGRQALIEQLYHHRATALAYFLKAQTVAS